MAAKAHEPELCLRLLDLGMHDAGERGRIYSRALKAHTIKVCMFFQDLGLHDAPGNCKLEGIRCTVHSRALKALLLMCVCSFEIWACMTHQVIAS